MAYSSTKELWDYFRLQTEVVGESAGTGDGSTKVFDLDQKYIISDSSTVYSAGTTITSGFTMLLDRGKLSFSAAPTGSVMTTDYDYAPIKDSVTVDYIQKADREIERKTGRDFDLATTTEYQSSHIGQKIYFTDEYPINTITTSINGAQENQPENWNTLSSGYDGDYLLSAYDKTIGRIRFMELGTSPHLTEGADNIRFSYSHGYSSGSIPEEVNELSILISMRQMLTSTVGKNIIEGKEITQTELDRINIRIDDLIMNLKRQNYPLI